MRIVAVTGGSGFIGRHFITRAAREQVAVRRLLRQDSAPSNGTAPNVTDLLIGDLADRPDWRTALQGVEVVVHLAAIAHRTAAPDADALDLMRKVNVTAVEDLAVAAAEVGVRRIVLVSSIGVNGVSTTDHPFTEADPPAPRDAYARSKLDAEQALGVVAAARGMEYVIVRPPLVYGPGAPGNFDRLMQLVRSGWPLPLGAVRNRRCFISIENLCDALWRTTIDGRARNEVFLVSDGEAVSTPDLIRCLAQLQGVPCRLFAVPVALLRASLQFSGRARDFERLCGSLEIDIGKIRSRLGWSPPQTLDEGLRSVVESG